MPIIRTEIKPPGRAKAGSTIYHLHMKTASKIIPCQADFYFGGIAAIYENFTASMLGISQQGLYDFGITPERPYENKICRITKAELKRKKGGRKNPKTT
jgi:hypothetical protein